MFARPTLAEETEDVAREDQIVLQEMAEQAAAMHMEETMMNHSEQDMNTTDESSQYAGLLASFRETERIYGGFEAWQRLDLADRTELDYEGWIVARTPEFKEYFGDWEAVRGDLPETLDGDLGRYVNNAMDIADGAINYYTGEPMGVIIDDYIELVQHAEEMGVSLKQLRAEYDAVAARYKDTPQWMQAPNGEPSRLTERQWVLVRTLRFKAFFGNWEMQRDKELPVIEVSDRMFNGDRKAAQKWLTDKANNIVGTHGNDETGMQIAVSANVLRGKSTSGAAQDKSRGKTGTAEARQRRAADHYEVLRQLPSLLKHASLAAAEAEKNNNRAVLGVYKFVVPARLDGVDYAVKLTVKDFAPGQGKGASFYTHELVDIEIGMPVHDMQTTEGEATEAGNGTGIAYSVGVLVDAVNRADAGAIPDASFAVASNGEPIVLNTGSPRSGFTVFDNMKGDKGDATPQGTAWFSDSLATAASYSGTTRAAVMLGDYYSEGNADPGNYACFLSIRNPYEVWFEGANWDGIHYGKVRIIEVANWMLLVEGREPVRACSPRP